MSDTLHVFLEASGSQGSHKSLEVTKDAVNYIKDNYEGDVRFYRYNCLDLYDVTTKIKYEDIKDIKHMKNILWPDGGSTIENVIERVNCRELENVILLTDGILYNMSAKELIEATKNWVVLWDGSDHTKHPMVAPHVFRVDKNTEENVKKALQAVFQKGEKDIMRVYIDGSYSVQEEDLLLWQNIVRELCELYDVQLMLPKRAVFVELDIDSFLTTPNPKGFVDMFGGDEFNVIDIVNHEDNEAYENNNVVLLTDSIYSYITAHSYNKKWLDLWTVVINQHHYSDFSNRDNVMWLATHNAGAIASRIFEHRWENRMEQKLNELEQLTQEVDNDRLEEYLRKRELNVTMDIVEIIIDCEKDKYDSEIWTLKTTTNDYISTWDETRFFATLCSAYDKMSLYDEQGIVSRIVFTDEAKKKIKKVDNIYGIIQYFYIYKDKNDFNLQEEFINLMYRMENE